MKFSITIPCKPYVKRYLEVTYGTPVDFTKDKSLYPVFRKKLEKPSNKRNSTYKACRLDKYTETVECKILQTDFYEFGWELTITDIISFNKEMEGRAKMFMYLIISSRISFGMAQTDAIRYFQERFDFPEEIWPAESINKDCQRNLTVSKNEIIENISELIDKIITGKLSEKRTICPKLKKAYETANI